MVNVISKKKKKKKKKERGKLIPFFEIENFKLSNHKFLANESLGLDHAGPYGEDIKAMDRGLFIKN
jgi:hypothetical protein